MRRPTQLRRAALGGDCGARRLQARARSPRGATVGRATGTLHGCTPSMSDATTAAASSTVRETPIAASNQTTNLGTLDNHGDEAGADGREDMAGINYSKWDSLEVSDSEDEEDAASRAVRRASAPGWPSSGTRVSTELPQRRSSDRGLAAEGGRRDGERSAMRCFSSAGGFCGQAASRLS